MKKTLLWIAAALAGVCIFTSCPSPTEPTDTRAVLTAGEAVFVDGTATTASATFTGAAGLTLTELDFTVSEGGAIGTVSKDGDDDNIVTVTVTFAANTGETDKTYTVGIAAGSATITGNTTVVITQAALDTRTALTAGANVSVEGTATTADVTFTGAAGLDLAAADFTVTTGGTIGTVSVNDDTVTVPVTFEALTGESGKTYSVGIAADSTKIRGSATVAIIQGDDTRATLTAGAAVSVDGTATTASVTFTGATGLNLAAADFTVSEGGVIGTVSVEGDTVTVPVTFAALTGGDSDKTYTVGIAAGSAIITGDATVAITQAAFSAELSAGEAVSVACTATTASVTFTGATGLTTLAKTDFTVTTGGAIGTVSIDGDTVTVTVTFAANTVETDKTYTVGIASNSTKIKGDAAVVITQAADTRTVLTAGTAVSVDGYAATTASVTFTGATGLSLTAADFTVTTGGVIGTVSIDGGTVTVSVSFAANHGAADKTYTVGIAAGSATIKGSTTVTITHKAPPVFARPVSETKAYSLVWYDPAGVVALEEDGGSGDPAYYTVTDTGLKALFNAIYTPNASGTTDNVALDGQAGYGKTAVAYTTTISEKTLGLFKITLGSAATDDKIEIAGETLPAATDASPAASTTNLIVIDIGVPGGTDNSSLPAFYIPDQGLGASDGSYAHIRLRVNRGASLVILADNSAYITGTEDDKDGGAGNSCPTGYFNGGCVEVMAGGKLRDGAFEGFPLGSNAVILNRLGSYLAVGPEPGTDDATGEKVKDAYNAYYSGWLIGPDGADTEKPRIKWDDGNQAYDYLEVRRGKLAISADVTLQKGLGLIYSVWFIGATTITIDVPDGAAPKLPGRGLFANGTDYKFYGTTSAQIIVKQNSMLHKMFLTANGTDAAKAIKSTTGDVTIQNAGTGEASQYVDTISGYPDWTIPADVEITLSSK